MSRQQRPEDQEHAQTPQAASAAGEQAPGSQGASRPPWWRRGPVLAGACVAAILAITVVTDLPQHASHSEQIAADVSTVDSVNSLLRSCAFAVNEAFTILGDQQTHQLTPAERAKAPSLLSDDQTACSLNNADVENLSTLELPGSVAGTYLEEIVSALTNWVTSDAQSAIEAIERLVQHPGDPAAHRQLQRAATLMQSDRRLAIADLAGATHALRARLPALVVPSVSPTIATG
jgi:hypothetical protein